MSKTQQDRAAKKASGRRRGGSRTRHAWGRLVARRAPYPYKRKKT